MKAATECYDCKRRYIGCHDRCQAYKDYKKSIEKQSMQSEVEYLHYVRGAIKRMTNYKNKGVQL